MGTGVRDKYSVGIGGTGYILKGSPDHPAHIRRIVKSQIDRLAISDVQYSDFAGDGRFFTAQTEWSNGIKDDKEWADDGKFWYSSNIDAYSSVGEISLEKELVEEYDFTNQIFCAANCSVAGTISAYIGTKQITAGSTHILIFEQGNLGTWTDIAGTTFGHDRTMASCMFEYNNKLVVLTFGSTTANAVEIWNGTTWTDKTADIDAVATGDVYSSLCGCTLEQSIYVFVKDFSTNIESLMSSNDDGATWVEEFTQTSYFTACSICNYGGLLFYLTNNNRDYVLWQYDPATGIKKELRKFYNGYSLYHGVGANNLLKVFNNKLIITIPGYNTSKATQIYSYDLSDFSEIYLQDMFKANVGAEARAGVISQFQTPFSPVESNNKLYWGNLIYDGEVFYNHKKPLSNLSTNFALPILVDKLNNIYYLDCSGNATANPSKLYRDASSGSIYKGTIAKNFLVFCQMGQIPSIDKLLYSLIVIHDKLLTGESFQMEYSIDNRATWVSAGIKTYTGDTTVRTEFTIPGNIIFNKIWLKVSMAGGATSPHIQDVILAYKPIADYKNLWQMRLDLSNSIKLLNNQTEQRDSKELLAQLWNKIGTSSPRISFEDVNYAECTVVSGFTSAATSCKVNTTSRFPRQGRARIVSGSVAEEIYYTSAGSNFIKGMTRGARKTKARSYPSGGITLKNDYDVIIDDLRTDTDFTDENTTESAAIITLIEI